MAQYVSTFTIDNIAYVNVVAVTSCWRIVLTENANGATTDILQKVPVTSNPIQKAAGNEIVFDGIAETTALSHLNGPFKAGDIVGQVKAVTAGTFTMMQEEFPRP